VSDEHEYADNLVVWLENGRKALDYMETDERRGHFSYAIPLLLASTR
jgi:hypothetical protein